MWSMSPRTEVRLVPRSNPWPWPRSLVLVRESRDLVPRPCATDLLRLLVSMIVVDVVGDQTRRVVVVAVELTMHLPSPRLDTVAIESIRLEWRPRLHTVLRIVARDPMACATPPRHRALKQYCCWKCQSHLTRKQLLQLQMQKPRQPLQ